MRAAPAVSRAKCNIEDAHEHTGSAEAIRPSLHGGLRLTSRSPRRPGFFATVIPEKLASQELDTSVGVSGPHDFAVRLSAVRQWHFSVHRIPPRVRDDREPPLSGTGHREYSLIFISEKQKYFCKGGLDRFLLIGPSGKFVGRVSAA